MSWYTFGNILVVIVVALIVMRIIRNSITKQDELPSSPGYTPHDEIYGGTREGNAAGDSAEGHDKRVEQVEDK